MKHTLWLICLLCVFNLNTTAQIQKKEIGESDKLIGFNLVKNPGAENITESNMPKDWETSSDDNIYVSNYGHVAGEWDYDCDKKCGLPENAGSYYFRAPAENTPGNTKRFLSQTIDLAKLNDTLKVREVDFEYSAQIAGFHCDEALKCAFGYIKIEFFDGSKQSLKIYDRQKFMNEFHRVDESEGADSRMHKFEKISLVGPVPANTAFAVITIGSEQNCGNADSPCAEAFVFFDNVSLKLSKKM